MNQGRFVRENLVQMAEIVGVADADAFEACLDDPAVEGGGRRPAQGRSVGIDSTPTLALSGPGGELVLRGFSQTWPTLRDAVEEVLGAPPSPEHPVAHARDLAVAGPGAAPPTSPSHSPPSAEPTPSAEPIGARRTPGGPSPIPAG